MNQFTRSYSTAIVPLNSIHFRPFTTVMTRSGEQ